MDEEIEAGQGHKWQHDSSDSSQCSSPRLEPDSIQADSKLEILDWQGEHDPGNPYNWTETRKWATATLMLFGTLVLTLNGTGITIAAGEISAGFNVLDTSTFTNTIWIVFSWNIGGAFFALFLPLLEDFGVKRPYMAIYTLFFAMVIAQALAQNYATLVITRFISGGCVSVLANTISSAIPDMWKGAKARSVPVGLYIVLYIVGNTIGPVVFAPVMQFIGNWRWVFYIQLIIYGALFPLYMFLLPETRGHTILGRRAKQIRRETGRRIYTAQERDAESITQRLVHSVTRPLYLLATEPVLLASTIWSAFALGLVFAFTQSVEQVFKELYSWKSYQCGYVQAAIAIGEILGWPVSLYGTQLYFNSARRNRETPGEPIPEARLYVSVFGSFLGITAGMFVYAWTSYPFLPWYAPAFGLAMVGFGIQIVVCTIADYVVDLYADSGMAGSAIAGVVVGEQIVAAALPLASASLYTNLGFHWASSLLGFVAFGLGLVPLAFLWLGEYLRARSPFMKSGGRMDVVVDEKL